MTWACHHDARTMLTRPGSDFCTPSRLTSIARGIPQLQQPDSPMLVGRGPDDIGLLNAACIWWWLGFLAHQTVVVFSTTTCISSGTTLYLLACVQPSDVKARSLRKPSTDRRDYAVGGAYALGAPSDARWLARHLVAAAGSHTHNHEPFRGSTKNSTPIVFVALLGSRRGTEYNY